MALDDDIAILAGAPVFSFLGRDALRLLTFAGERRNLAVNEVLFARGERTDGGYVVLSGLVEVAALGGATEPVRAGRSAVIGRNALFFAGKRPSEARAREPSEVMRVTPQLMHRVLKEFPEAAGMIRDWLADDLIELMSALTGVRAKFLGPAQTP